jgi:glc operon protein GlcG
MHTTVITVRHRAMWILQGAMIAGTAATLAGPAAAQPAAPSTAQTAATPATMDCGVSVALDRAREIIARARLEGQRNNWAVAIAVVDTGGNLVAVDRMDQTQALSIQIAVDKARTANGLKRSTKALEDAAIAGRTAILSLSSVVAVEGGLRIVVNGRVVGSGGVSGASSAQDGQVAAAGLVEP